MKINNLIKLNVYDRNIYYDQLNDKFNIEKDSSNTIDVDNLDVFIRSKISNKRFYLKLSVTENCNLECPYCYQVNSEYDRTFSSKKVGKRELEILKKFIRIHLEKPEIESFQLAWYGGEPLLEIETIIELNKWAREVCNDLNVLFYSDITTNGVLLTEDIALSLKDSHISTLSITIDGDENEHNKYRYSIKNQETYRTIMANINNAAKYFDIIISYLSKKHDNYKILQTFINIQNSCNYKLRFFIGRLENIEGCLPSSLEQYDIRDFTQYKNNLHKKMIKEFLYIGDRAVHNLGAGYCYANTDYGYCLTPDLKVFKCQEAIGIDRLSVGHINHNGQFISDNTAWNADNLISECKKCELLLSCGGGCRYKRVSGDETCTNGLICKDGSFDYSLTNQTFENLSMNIHNNIRNKHIEQKIKELVISLDGTVNNNGLIDIDSLSRVMLLVYLEDILDQELDDDLFLVNEELTLFYIYWKLKEVENLESKIVDIIEKSSEEVLL